MSEWKGIDVSKYQGEIDWAKVKASGISFAMLRAGVSDGNGNVIADSMLSRNLKETAAVGIAVGVYTYLMADSADAAIRAAQQTIALTNGYEIAYPIAGDFEDKKYFAKTKQENTAIAKAFLQEVANRNFYPIFYTYTAFTNAYLLMQELSSYDLWIADYRETVGYKGTYTMWQYSSKESINGITTAVDADIAYVDYPKRIREQGKNHLSPAPTVEKWRIDIYSFRQESRAQEIAGAFRTLNLYSEVQKRGSEWAINMYSFQERTKADEISAAIQTLGFYNEVKPMTV